MKSLFVFAITGLIIFSSFSFDDRNLAHAEYDGASNYYCGTSKDYAVLEYYWDVHDLNAGVDDLSRKKSIEELNKQMVQPGGSVEILGKMAACLYKTHHVDPDDVFIVTITGKFETYHAKFSDKAQAVLSYDMAKLVQVAPGLADYATVPEFGSLASVTMIVSVLGVILIHRKFQK